MKQYLVWLLLICLSAQAKISSEQWSSIFRTGGYSDSTGNRYDFTGLPGYQGLDTKIAENFLEGFGLTILGSGVGAVSYMGIASSHQIALAVGGGFAAVTFLGTVVRYGSILNDGTEIAGELFSDGWDLYWHYDPSQITRDRNSAQARLLYERDAFGWYLAYPWLKFKNGLLYTGSLIGSTAYWSVMGIAAPLTVETVTVLSPFTFTAAAGAAGYGTGYALPYLGLVTGGGIAVYGAGYDMLGGCIISGVGQATYNGLYGSYIRFLCKEQDWRTADGEKVLLSDDSPDFQHKLAFEDSISEQLLNTLEIDRLAEQLITTDSLQQERQQRISPLQDSISSLQVQSSELSAEINRLTQQISEEDYHGESVINPVIRTESNPASFASQTYLDSTAQNFYTSMRLEQELKNLAVYQSLSPGEQLLVKNRAAQRYKEIITGNFAKKSDGRSFEFYDLLVEFFSAIFWF